MKKFILYLAAAFCFLLISNSASAQVPVISYVTPVTLPTNQSITLNPTNTGGTGITSYTLSGSAIPTGMLFSTTSGALSGTPTVAGGPFTYNIFATNASGNSATTTLVVTIAAGNTVAPVISYPASPYTFFVGDQPNLILTNSNQANTTGYSITNAAGLAAMGLSFSTATGTISGTVTTITATTTFTVTATVAAGVTGTTDITITVIAGPPVISYTTPAPLTVGVAVPHATSPITPTNTGGAVATGGNTYGTGTAVVTGAAGAYGMAVDAGGNVYVTNVLTNTITEYSAAGATTVNNLTGLGAAGPIGLVFDASGNAFVLEQTSNSVVEYAGGDFTTTPTTVITGLSTPTGIAIAPATSPTPGVIYVANSGNNTVTGYTPSWTLSLTITGTTGFGGRNVSGGIAVDAAGQIYVVDNSRFGFRGSAIDVYSSGGTFVARHRSGNTNTGIYINSASAASNIFITSAGGFRRGGAGVNGYSANFAANIANEGGLSSPRGVVFDAAGDLFVSDYNTGTVTEYPVVKGYVLTGTLPAGLNFDTTTGAIWGTPIAAFPPTTYTVTAYNASGGGSTTVTISCVSNPPVISYTPNPAVYAPGTIIILPITVAATPAVIASGYTTPGTGLTGATTALSGPWGMTKDGSGNIWVVNGNNTIDEYSAAGVFMKTVTVTGTAGTLTGITINGTNIYLSSSTGGVYTITTSTSAATRLANTGANLQGIVYDPTTGFIYTTTATGAVLRLTTNGRFNFARTLIPGLTNATGVTVDASGNIYVLTLAGTLTEYSSAGTFERTVVSGVGTATYGLYIDASGDYYISDSASGTVKEYNTAGTLVATTTTGGNPRGLVTDASGDMYVADHAGNAVNEYTPSTYYTAVLTSGTAPTTPALTFNPLTGAFTTATGATPFGPLIYTVTAYGSGGTATTTVTITCTAAPIFTYPSPDTYTAGTAVPLNFLVPTVTANGPVNTYSAASLPPGLTINAATGAINGTPTTVAPATAYVITGTNTTTNLSGTFTITITVIAGPPVISYTPSTDVYLVNALITPLNLVNTGGPATSYSISAPLPTGLIFDTTTGDITGTPTVVTAATTYTVTAIGSAGVNATCQVIISVVSNPVIAYTTPDVYVVGSATSTPCACTTLSPVNTGSTPTSYAISTPLPAGLIFNTTNGQITGTPTVVAAATDYTVTATDALGHTGTTIVNITVNPAPPTISYTPTSYIYTVGTTITPIFPLVTGSPTSYSISVALPAGLTFNTTNGEILGTPTAASALTSYTVTATNAGGSTTCAPFTILVNALGIVIHYTTPDIIAENVAMIPLYPISTGGITPTSYAITGTPLPAGLSIVPATGEILGTPTVTVNAKTYTITATSGAATGTTTVTITCFAGIDWLGGTSTDWNDGTNWGGGVQPGSANVAFIGVNVAFTNFPNVGPAINPNLPTTVGSIVIGNNGGQAGGFVVNSGSPLTVKGDITYQSDLNSNLGYTATISGTDAVTVAGGISVVANTDQASLVSYTPTLTTSVPSLTIGSAVGTGTISLISSQDGSFVYKYSPVFSITGGTVLLNGTIQTTNSSFGTSTISVTNATLQFANVAALAGLSAAGVNNISFNNTGATIEYAGTINQTYYTDAAITGHSTGVTYNSIKFSGSGIKTPTGTSVSNLNIAGDFTNTLVTSATVYVDLSLPTVNFTGAAENIAAGTGTTFYKTTCKGTGIKTIVSGKAYIASSGVLTMAGTATLAAGGLLTLNSDVTGSATVAAIPAGCSITGNVNVQRFLTGGVASDRGYRLLSSPVHDLTTGFVSMNYLLNSCYIKGTAGVAGGFDGGGNPNLYLYRENLAPSNQSFISGNYRGINTLYAGTETVTAGVGAVLTNVNYLVDIDGGPYHVPVGNGYLFFFRGDRNAAGLNAEAIVSYVPTSTTLTAVGPLNQGSITVADWYTPGSPNLGFTNTAGNSTVQGFNLVGNPYASSIDFDTFSQTNAAAGIYGGANVTAFSYIYDAASQNYSVYQQGNNGGGTIATVNANIIPSGQGFFVRATSAAAQLVFNEAAKTNTQATALTGNLFLGMPAPAAISQSLHIMLTRDSVTNNVSRDGILIVFDKDASPKYSRMEDAPHKPGNGTVGLASMSADTVSLAINRMPFPTLQTQKIPLTVTAAATGLYQLNFTATKSIPALYTMWLKDAYKQDSLDIRANPIYSFNIDKSDPASFGANRFSLVMSENPALMVHLLDFNATKAKGGSQVVWKTENEQNYTNFTVERSTDGGVTFTVLGGYASSALGTYSFLDGNPAMKANQYRLKIQDLNGTISYSKVVTLIYGNGDSPLTAHMNVYPNPSTDVINVSIPSSTVSNSQTNLSGLQTLATTPGLVSTNSGSSSSYDIKIISITGSVIKSATSASTNWQGSVSGLAPGTYIIQVTNNSDKSLVGRNTFVKL